MGGPKFAVCGVWLLTPSLGDSDIAYIHLLHHVSHVLQIHRHFSDCVTLHVRISRRLEFNSGPLPIVIGILTFIVPLFGGLCFRNLYADNMDPHYMPPKKVLAERNVMISSQSSVLLPTVTFILLELKILSSELGRLVLSASMINDILGMIVSILAYSYPDFIAVIIFFLVVFFIFRPAVEWIVHRTPEGKPVADNCINAVILIAMDSSAYSASFNMKYLLGPFTVGLVIPDGPPLGSALEAKYYDLTKNVLVPISIAFSTMRCDVMKIIYEFDDIMYNMFLLVLTLFMKLAAGVAPCLYCNFPEIFLYESSFDDSRRRKLGFPSRMSLVSLSYGPLLRVSNPYPTFMVVYALLNSAIVPAVLPSLDDPKRKYIGHRKRNISGLKPESDLQILTCVRGPENISGDIAFLQLFSSPIMVTILHLLKLVGKIIPVLITHNMKSNQQMNNSYINTANLAFNKLDSVTMTMFTVMTHENLMHDEICTLALDQITSMVIVPSGRKWTIEGEFESDDEAIRRLNLSLLEHAPCSVGILVNRGQFSCRDTRNCKIDVCVIFIGGKDDREAVSLVMRMKLNPRVNVSVIRMVSNQETETLNWEHILDHEKTFTDGPEVASTIRLLSKDYDLMVVGRNHGMAIPDFSGLTEWIELSELGVVGDLLAARDLKSRVSILVVQQQQT
ncbi:hypothetical protein Bca52824_023058 [Brassica carinata]|uniref:Cation/H+ exchanger domain-containing protein n=1 Tax=Brassica carinata TaxID=52824 RepID=A0A8X7VHQ4_BRACI|nr:hypothetical protein Bca52824_023058 [Brassica carinata]